MKYLAGWITSWNQDCQEKYQRPQIWRWYHYNGRKWRGTKQPRDEGERGEWKASLKLNIQKLKIMAPTHHFMANRWGESGNSGRFTLLGSKSLWMVTAAMKLQESCSLDLFFGGGGYSFYVYSCHLFLISSASVRSIPFLSFIVLIFAWNVPLVSLFSWRDL